MKYPRFVKGSVSANLDRYRRCIFEQVDRLVSEISASENNTYSEDALLNFQTTIIALLGGLAEEIIDLAGELGEIEHE